MSHKRLLGRAFVAGWVVVGGLQLASAQGLAGSDAAAAPGAATGGVVNAAPRRRARSMNCSS